MESFLRGVSKVVNGYMVDALIKDIANVINVYFVPRVF